MSNSPPVGRVSQCSIHVNIAPATVYEPYLQVMSPRNLSIMVNSLMDRCVSRGHGGYLTYGLGQTTSNFFLPQYQARESLSLLGCPLILRCTGSLANASLFQALTRSYGSRFVGLVFLWNQWPMTKRALHRVFLTISCGLPTIDIMIRICSTMPRRHCTAQPMPVRTG